MQSESQRLEKEREQLQQQLANAELNLDLAKKQLAENAEHLDEANAQQKEVPPPNA